MSNNEGLWLGLWWLEGTSGREEEGIRAHENNE